MGSAEGTENTALMMTLIPRKVRKGIALQVVSTAMKVCITFSVVGMEK